MDEHVAAIIDYYVGQLRTAAGPAWVEPERVRLTLRAKARLARGWPIVVAGEIEIELPSTTLRVQVGDGKARIRSLPR